MTKLMVLMLFFFDFTNISIMFFFFLHAYLQGILFLHLYHQLGHMDSFHSILSVSNVGFCFEWGISQSCQQPEEKNVKVVTPPSN